MNIESIRAKLSDAEFSALSEHVADLTGQRDAARQESIEGRKKLRSEVETLRSTKAQLFEKLGLDDDADLDALPEAKGQAEAAKQLEARLKRMERDLADAVKVRGEIETKFQASRREAALTKALASHDFIDSDLVGSYASGRLRFEGDEMLFETDDGKLVSVDDGIKHLAAVKPHLLKARGAGGSGHVPGAGSAGGTKNPWAHGSENITEQISLAKENPNLAAQLKAAARK
jgi:hypothetical protein